MFFPGAQLNNTHVTFWMGRSIKDEPIKFRFSSAFCEHLGQTGLNFRCSKNIAKAVRNSEYGSRKKALLEFRRKDKDIYVLWSDWGDCVKLRFVLCTQRLKMLNKSGKPQAPDVQPVHVPTDYTRHPLSCAQRIYWRLIVLGSNARIKTNEEARSLYAFDSRQ